MATLVLTAVGTALGGPIGGAIGALVGQSIDAELFKPKGREGPRLTDLKIQTSSYGTQIPQIFGTMRVSGTVIWATDLIEHRSRSGGGKGRPSTTTFQYSASFAVAVSSRPIIAVRRIWADGNLLRGSDGALKERGTLRVLTGGAAQATDPAIGTTGNAGSGGAIAHRGLAIALFEDLDLSAFGNRIPQLSFEVEADAGALDAAAVGNALIGSARVAASKLPVGGYAAVGDTLSDAIVPLAEVDGWGLGDDPLDAAWSIAPRDLVAGAARRLRDYRCLSSEAAEMRPVRRTRTAGREAPSSVRLRYYDPARDFQTSQQSALVAGGGRRVAAIDLPATGGADAMAAQAGRIAARAATAREIVTIEGDFAALALPIGAVVTAEEVGLAGPWRVSERNFRDGRILLTLTRHRVTGAEARAGEAGRIVASVDWPHATGRAVLIDLPPGGELAATVPQFAVAIGGSNAGWRGADLWWRRHPDVEPLALGRVPPATAIGVTLTPLDRGTPALFDDAHGLTIQLIDPDMVFVNASDAAVDAGANRAFVGDEPIQFGRAVPLGEGRWRLSRLLRARQGCEDRSGPHASGVAFVLVDTASVFPLGSVEGAAVRGGTIEWAAVGSGASATLALGEESRALQPLSPVHPRIVREGEAIRLSWTRRSRVGFAWRDQVDAPIGEAALHFEVVLTGAAGASATHETDAVDLTLDRAALATLGGGGDIDVAVRQYGDFAVSPPLAFKLPAALLA